MKAVTNRKFWFAYGSLNYNPENDLLYLDVSLPDDVSDLELRAKEDGFLEPHETYKAYYNSLADMPFVVRYQEARARDLELDLKEQEWLERRRRYGLK